MAHMKLVLMLRRLVHLPLLLSLLLLGGCMSPEEEAQLISLQGPWEYRLGFEPEWLRSTGPSGWRPIQLPHLFGREDSIPPGPVTLTIRRPLPPRVVQQLNSDKPQAIDLGRLSDVSLLYLNGTRIAQLGELGPYRSAFYKHMVTDIPHLKITPDHPVYMAIVLHTEGVYPLHVEGPELLLGPSGLIHKQWFRAETLTLLLLSVYMIVGVHHLIHFARRPREKFNLYFGLFCILISGFWIFRTGLREEIFGDQVLLRKRLEYLLILAASAPMVLFVASLLNTRSRWIRLTLIYTALLALLVMFGDYKLMRLSLTCWQVVSPLVVAYMLYLTTRQARRGDRWARSLLLGFILLFLGLIVDIAGARGFLPYQRGVATLVFPAFVLGVADLLARRYAEVYQQAEELNQQLERRVSERTHALAEALESAEISNRAKSVFLAQLSHEFRTPMHGILGSTELLLDLPLNAEQRSLVQTIRGTGQSFLRLLNDALDMARLGAGGISLRPEPVALRPWLSSIAQLFSTIAQRKGLQLTVELAEEVPEAVVMDPVRARQVLSNLLGNAVRFTLKGRVIIRLKLLGQSDAAATLRFEVEDTGPGIPESFQPHLFEPFAQADSSLSRAYGGTGLGTTIAKHIIEAMEGTIGFKSPISSEPSSPGPGTLFWFEVTVQTCVAPVSSPGEMPQVFPGPSVPRPSPTPPQSRFEGRESAGEQRSAPTEKEAPTSSLPFTSAAESAMVEKEEAPVQPTPSRSEPYTQPPSALGALKSTSPAGLTNARTAGLSILVVEDNAVNQMILQRQLSALGARVTLAVDGARALEAARESSFQLILMDVQMPVMDGLEASRRLRSELHISCPIIALTANAFPEDRARCLDAGMNEVLAKPCTRDELKKILEHWTSPGEGKAVPV